MYIEIQIALLVSVISLVINVALFKVISMHKAKIRHLNANVRALQERSSKHKNDLGTIMHTLRSISAKLVMLTKKIDGVLDVKSGV